MMTLPEFHNGLRILRNIDSFELTDAGLTEKQREAFFADPYTFFIRCDDPTCAKLWSIVERRMGGR